MEFHTKQHKIITQFTSWEWTPLILLEALSHEPQIDCCFQHVMALAKWHFHKMGRTKVQKGIERLCCNFVHAKH